MCPDKAIFGTLIGGVLRMGDRDAVAPVVITRLPGNAPGRIVRFNASVNPNGTTSTTNWFSWGKPSTVLELDGVDDCANLQGTSFNSYPLTVAAWVRTGKVGATGTIASKYVAGSLNGWCIRMEAGQLKAWYFASSANHVGDQVQGIPGGLIDDGEWHQIAMTVGDSGGRIYIDGSLRSSLPWTGTPGPCTTAETLRFGFSTGFAGYFPGQLDEVTLWNQELTLAQIRDLAKSSPTPAHPLFAKLLGAWLLDGDMSDGSGKNGAGALAGGGKWVSNGRANLNHVTPGTVVAGTNRVADLNGMSAYVDVPDGPWFTGDFTIETWIYLRRYNNWCRILDFGNGTPSDNVVFSPNSDQGRPALVIFRGGSSQSLQAPERLPLNEWIHVAATLSGSEAKLLINGVPVACGSIHIPASVLRTNNYIGRSGWAVDANTDCMLDDFRIWNEARTAIQISEHLNSPVSPSDSRLLLNYQFDETSGEVVKDTRLFGAADGVLMSGAARALSVEARINSVDFPAGGTYDVQAMVSGASGSSAGKPIRLVTPTSTGGAAVEFGGVGDFARLVRFGRSMPSEITVEFWVQIQQLANGTGFLLDPDNYANRFFGGLWQASGNRIYWDYGDIGAGGRLYFDFSENVLGSWQHFAFVASRSNNCMKIFRNGKLAASANQFNDFALGDYSLRLGQDLKGLLDEFRIWSRARSAEEILTGMNDRISGNEPGLAVYYGFDEGAGSTLHDGTANANSALLVNGPGWRPSGVGKGVPLLKTRPAMMVTTDTVKMTGQIDKASQEEVAWFEWWDKHELRASRDGRSPRARVGSRND